MQRRVTGSPFREYSANKHLDYIPSDNLLVRHNDKLYRWKNIRAIFAFSDKYNVNCNLNADVDYVEN